MLDGVSKTRTMDGMWRPGGRGHDGRGHGGRGHDGVDYFHVIVFCFFSVSLEQIRNLNNRFQQLSGNEETIR